MLQELSHMDRITQLQDGIQQVWPIKPVQGKKLLHLVKQLLTIMSNSIGYLTMRFNFLQVSPEIPIMKQRNPEKYNAPEVFEGS
jgi:mediator of RNA polymerase II transcription subunit 21